MRYLILFLLLLGACAQQADVVKVGYMGPLSGDAASYGESIKRGVELAQEKYGGPIELVVADSKCEGKEAVSAINKLITVDGVDAVIGEVCSGATLAAAPIATQHEIVMISPSATSPELSNASPYFFRTIPSDAGQGRFGAELAREQGYGRLAIIYSNEEYGLGFANVLEGAFTELGGKVVAREAIQRGSVDLRTPMTKVKEAQPDIIYLISNSPDTSSAALQQLAELDVKAAVYGSEGLKSDAILEVAGDAAEGLLVTSVSSGTTTFAKEHTKKYGSGPGPFAAQGYDAYKALAVAVKEGARNGEQIQAALEGVGFKGASGTIDFDEQGDIEGNYDVYIVENGTFVSHKEPELALQYTP